MYRMFKTKFVPSSQLHTAVLFLVFNRPDTTRRVFEAIRQAKPPRLYVAADGPRPDKEGEAERIQAVRDHVMRNIDWDCQVQTLFRDINLGCKKAVGEAITWFFEYEEEGIILEDDCLPEQSFFWFCEELLQRFRNDERIFMITGRNHLWKWKARRSSYFYSLCDIWGWATWKRAWKYFDPELGLWEDSKAQENMQLAARSAPHVVKECISGCEKVLEGRLCSWGYPWVFNMIAHGGLGVTPSVNLIANIGFGEDATHTTSLLSPHAFVEAHAMRFPLRHNLDMQIDCKYYEKYHQKMMMMSPDKAAGRFIDAYNKDELGKPVAEALKLMMKYPILVLNRHIFLGIFLKNLFRKVGIL